MTDVTTTVDHALVTVTIETIAGTMTDVTIVTTAGTTAMIAATTTRTTAVMMTVVTTETAMMTVATKQEGNRVACSEAHIPVQKTRIIRDFLRLA
mmetsp:Transcript_86971/g.120667  ORF Transcript_86971/g.120667 Transcript_86971/m.120667 type:complete len:95 (+) Transcript_86971:492-776(+)